MWKRELSNDEMQKVDELHCLLTQHQPVMNNRDTLLWDANKCYTVKAFQQVANRGVIYDNLVCQVWMNLAKWNSSCG